MVIKNMKFMFLILLLLTFTNIAKAAEKIKVERYEIWKHPVLAIFEKYGIKLYKVSYSIDGKCPTFYAKFKYSPDPRAPDADSFHKVYFEILKANSFFPYALVDSEDDMRINVGWVNKIKKIMRVDIDKALSRSTCIQG